MNPPLDRRQFLQGGAIGLVATALTRGASSARHPPLPDFVGLNVSSLARHYTSTIAGQRVDPYDVPRIMREDLDLRACFEIGRKAGFRGPWCIEHVHRVAPGSASDKVALWRELKWIAGQLRSWTA